LIWCITLIEGEVLNINLTLLFMLVLKSFIERKTSLKLRLFIGNDS
jgi:hypothetical protein